MILESVVIVGFALLLDFLVGDPKTRYHPTAWIGKLIASIVPFTKSNSAKRELIGGILLVSVIVVAVCTVLVVLDIGISLLTIDIVSLIVSNVVGSILLGAYDPMHPPITFPHITKNLFVSIDLFGPTKCDHHPLLFVIGLIPLTN